MNVFGWLLGIPLLLFAVLLALTCIVGILMVPYGLFYMATTSFLYGAGMIVIGPIVAIILFRFVYIVGVMGIAIIAASLKRNF